jgi:hypothetical protein
MPARRFPPPWTVEDIDAAYVVRDRDGQALAYFYYENEPGWNEAPACQRDFLGLTAF